LTNGGKTLPSLLFAIHGLVVGKEPRDDAMATFVIRIRLEAPADRQKDRAWVAHITNVIERSERWVSNLDELSDFFEKQLARMGATPQKASAGSFEGEGE
jgi:hypothetical protein